MSASDDRQPWIEYPTDELRELIADAHKDAEGPDGAIRVRLPPAANFFLVDPSSHLVVMHRRKIVDMADCLTALSDRSEDALARLSASFEEARLSRELYEAEKGERERQEKIAAAERALRLAAVDVEWRRNNYGGPSDGYAPWVAEAKDEAARCEAALRALGVNP